MITFLNRRKLMCDVSSGPLVTARDRLRAAGIPCEMNTARPKGRRQDILESSYRGRIGLSRSVAAPEAIFVYSLYVRRRDYARAKELLEL